MWHFHLKSGWTRSASLVGAAAFALFVVLLSDNAVRADAVEDLAVALQVRSGELVNQTAETLAHREADIQKRIRALQTISELRRALALQEWNDDPTRSLVEPLRRIDAKLRQQVGNRLLEAIRGVVKTGNPNSKLAVANLIAEMGPDVRSIMPEGDGKQDSMKGFARTLTPEVVQLAADSDLAVRQEALRALGNIFPKSEIASAVLKRTLEKDAVGPRRLAAESLIQMVKVVNHLQRKTRSTSGVEANRQDLLDTVTHVVKLGGAGTRDSDAQVRESCLQALQVSAQAIADLIPEGAKRTEYPREGRELTEEERKKIEGDQARSLKDIGELVVQLKAFQQLGGVLAQTLEDRHPRVQMAALAAAENFGIIRFRLIRLVRSTPQVKGDDGGLRALFKSCDPLGEFLPQGLGLISRLLGDRDVQLRRAAVDVLEILEVAAKDAIPLLTQSLTDPDRFVRIAAARAIANIDPQKAEAAVPRLAKMLSDPDLSIRVAAAKTLRTLGALAVPAVPALASAVADGDAEGRIEAMGALETIGAEAGKSALPQLIQALEHSDLRVRRAAAKTLGAFGAAAATAVPALRRTLGDDDAEVRTNASDAILSILVTQPKKD